MHILNAFLHFTSHGRNKRRTVGNAGPVDPNTSSTLKNSSDPHDESTSLLSPMSPEEEINDQSSFTDTYTDFATSTQALRFCLFHAACYYAMAVTGFCLFVEHWTIPESFYYATVLFTTIGFGDFAPTTAISKVFTSLLALYGIIILGIFLGVAGEMFVEANHRALTKRQTLVAHNVMEAIRDGDKAKEDIKALRNSSSKQSLPHAMWNVIVLEAPIVLILFLIGLLIGYLEGWSILDSAYWFIITGTTIGLGDYYPTRPVTQLLATIYLPLLVAVLGELLARIASAYMEQHERQTEQAFLSRSLTLTDIEKMDTNRDGQVDKAEFLAYMLIVLKKVNKADIDEISQLFHKLDVTCNNSLTKQDVAFRMEKLQELFTVPTTTNIS